MRKLTVIVTDVKYRMSLALMRDLAEAGIRVAAAGTKSPAGGLPLGFSSRAASETVLLPEEEYKTAVMLLRFLFERRQTPALLPVGAATLSPPLAEEVSERFSATSALHPGGRNASSSQRQTRAAKLAAELSAAPRAFEPERRVDLLVCRPDIYPAW